MSDLLQRIFARKPADSQILIWQIPAKRSRWYSSPDNIPLDQLQAKDTYFGVGAAPKGIGQYRRAKAEQIEGIGAIWLDIDIANEAHKKKNLPESRDAAYGLLSDCFREQPSYLIDSGHGLQAYWLLDEWLEINETNRQQLQACLFRFASVWREFCHDKGFDADSVFDFARVMRLPGTVNHKVPSDPAPVVDWMPDLERTEYNFRGLIAHLPAAKPIKTSAIPRQQALPEQKPKPDLKVVQGGKSDYPPFDEAKWEALKLADPRVEESFNYARPDISDQSPSAYDMSIAALLVRAGWTNEETLGLLIHCRRTHGEEIKRPAYYISGDVRRPGVIEKVRMEAEAEAAGATTLSQLSSDLGIDIRRIVRYASDPPSYKLELMDGRDISCGEVENVTSQTKFRNKVAAAVGLFPHKRSAGAWDNTVRMLLGEIEHETAGEEATEQGQVKDWLGSYLAHTPPHEDRDDALANDQTWKEGDVTFICALAFKQYLKNRINEIIPARQLGLMLKSIGCIDERCTYTHENRQARKNCWKIPKGTI